jgi:site-specific recombinase XerD
MGSFRGEFVRKSLNTTSWERGTAILREWEDSEKQHESLDVEDAGERFLEDAKSRHLSIDTLNKYKLIFREMSEFFGKKQLNAISVDDLSLYRSSWKMAAITSLKKLERVKAFFGFSKNRGWVKENRAVFLKTPKTSFAPTLPFTAEQFEKILWATEVFPKKGIYGDKSGARIRAFVLLLRYTGLRIRDVVGLRWLKDIQNTAGEWRVSLYTQKTGQAVYVPIPREVAEEIEVTWMQIDKSLAAVRGERYESLPDYLFWSGIGNIKSAVGDWQRSLRRLFKIAGMKGHAHMFRDTFAVDLLQKGVPIETVAVLLGHSSIRITEKHYSPWVKSRQLALEGLVKKTWV